MSSRSLQDEIKDLNKRLYDTNEVLIKLVDLLYNEASEEVRQKQGTGMEYTAFSKLQNLANDYESLRSRTRQLNAGLRRW